MDGRNPAPTDIGFQPSKVVQDFFHPQYHCYPDMTFLVVVEDDSVVNTQFLLEPENACHWFWILGVLRGGGKHAPNLETGLRTIPVLTDSILPFVGKTYKPPCSL